MINAILNHLPRSDVSETYGMRDSK